MMQGFNASFFSASLTSSWPDVYIYSYIPSCIVALLIYLELRGNP